MITHYLSKTSDDKNQNYSEQSEQNCFERTVFAVGFGQNVARSDIKQKTGKKSEIKNQEIFW